MATTLTFGLKYDQASIRHIGWTEGDGSGHEGYHADDYFGANGEYMGPDAHGIEPIFVPTDAGDREESRCGHRTGDGRASAADDERFAAGDECPDCGCTLGSDGHWYVDADQAPR